MIVSRIGAYLFLCLMIMVIGVEELRLLEGEDVGWVSISQVIDFIFSNITEKNDVTESSNYLALILNFPAIFAFMITSILLFFISRNRKR